MKILIIDDCPLFLTNIKWLFTDSKINSEVLCFVDAFEALKYINDHQKEIRIVFTDYNMKKYGMSGSIIAQKCQEISLPVIICTGYDETDFPPHYKVVAKVDAQQLIHIAQQLPRKLAS